MAADRTTDPQGDDGVALSLDGRLLAGNDPRRSQQSRIHGIRSSIQSQTLIIACSPLLGYGLSDLLTDPSVAVLGVELEPRLKALFDDPRSEIPRSARLKTATDVSIATRNARPLIARLAIRRVRLLTLSAAVNPHRKAYRDIEQLLIAEVERFWRNRATELRLGHRWVINLTRNVKQSAQSVDRLVHRIGSSVVIVGAGPGLDRYHEWLQIIDRDHRKRITLIALDTALPLLARLNVEPDIIWAMDGQIVNARDFVPWHWSRCLVAADLTVHPSVLRRFRAERRFVFLTRFADVGFFTDTALRALVGRTPIFAPRGSVAPSLVAFLLGIPGVKRIISVGIEFRYKKPLTHARGSAIDRHLRLAMTRLRRRDGFEETEARPTVAVSGQTGENADRVLADHAAQLRDLVGAEKKIGLYRLEAPALDAGFSPISAKRAIIEIRRYEASGRKTIGAPDSANSDNDGISHLTTAIDGNEAGLLALLQRIRTQEDKLNAALYGRGDLHWDAGLDFVLRDLPQWPLMTVRRAWFLAQIGRIAPILRDYRRRLERIVGHDAR